ncbi:hypothetical protein ABTJ36_13645 [Acinetobacter baumannii]
MTIEYDEFDYELSRYFRETYKSDSRIANDILNLVDLIGIQDIQLLHEPKNMILIKVKFLENGRKVHFTVILGVREIFLANLI